MAMNIPTFEATFNAAAAQASARALRGVLAVVVDDNTMTASSATYGKLSEVDSSDYTSATYAVIQRAFLAEPYKVIVVKKSDSLTAVLNSLQFNWVCSNVSALQATLVTYVSTYNAGASLSRKVKAVVVGQSSANNMHVVAFNSGAVKVGGATVTALDYVARIGGILAACPLSEAVTHYQLTDLDTDFAPTTIQSEAEEKSLCITQDDDAMVLTRAVNTLSTLSTGQTASMKKICVVEAMDATMEDVVALFKAHWIRKKNSADNQALFVAEVNEALKKLVAEQAIDANGGTTARINADAMRAAWRADGVDVSSLTDAQILEKTYGSKVFLALDNIRYLDAMEDISMAITLEL